MGEWRNLYGSHFGYVDILDLDIFFIDITDYIRISSKERNDNFSFIHKLSYIFL